MSLHLSVRSVAFVSIGNMWVYGAERFMLVEHTSYPTLGFYLTERVEIWARPGSTVVVYADVFLPGIASGLGELTNEYRNVRTVASTATNEPLPLTLQFRNAIPPGETYRPMSPPGAVFPLGNLFELSLLHSASGIYELSFRLEADYYWREWYPDPPDADETEPELSPFAGWFGSWQFDGTVTSDNTVRLTLHVIPDAQTLVLFAVGAVTVAAGMRRKRL